MTRFGLTFLDSQGLHRKLGLLEFVCLRLSMDVVYKFVFKIGLKQAQNSNYNFILLLTRKCVMLGSVVLAFFRYSKGHIAQFWYFEEMSQR